MDNRKIIELTEFTDPVCTWCWGSEPILRKLELIYGNQLKVKFVMGGLVKDIREFYDSANNIGGDARQSNMQIARHWLEASERHGMPVKKEGFNLFSDEYPSTYPQNIAYKAAQMEDQELADRFLRRIREASGAEARQTNKPEVLIELATEVGLDVSRFIERFADGSADAKFKEDLEIIKRYGIRGFPTFLVKYGEKQVLLHGYQSFNSMKAVINSLVGDSIKESVPEKTERNVLDFIDHYRRVTPVEIQTAFDYTKEEVQNVNRTTDRQKIDYNNTSRKWYFYRAIEESDMRVGFRIVSYLKCTPGIACTPLPSCYVACVL